MAFWPPVVTNLIGEPPCPEGAFVVFTAVVVGAFVVAGAVVAKVVVTGGYWLMNSLDT